MSARLVPSDLCGERQRDRHYHEISAVHSPVRGIAFEGDAVK